MNLTVDYYQNWLKNSLPGSFCTISSKSIFFISFDSNKLWLYRYDKKVLLSSEHLLEIILIIYVQETLDTLVLKAKFKKWNFYLPVALEFLAQQGVHIKPNHTFQHPMKKMGLLTFISLKKSLIDEQKVMNKFSDEMAKYASNESDMYFDGQPLYETDLIGLDHLNTEDLEIIYSQNFEPKKAHTIIPVPFATNRQKSNDSYNGTSDTKISYGVANISVPITHKKCKLERPLGIFGFNLKAKKEKHFTFDSISDLSELEFIDYLKSNTNKKCITIFIHGFNVTFEDAAMSAAQFKLDVLEDLPIILYSWPSKGSIFGYDHDRENALYSAPILSQLLKTISELGFEEVVVMAHSMGTFCLSESLRSEPRTCKLINRAILAASDVSSKTFIDHYAEKFINYFHQTSIYASSKDIALLISTGKSSHDRVGDADPVCVVNGIDTVDVSKVDHGFWSLRHSYHSKHEQIIQDLVDFIKQGTPAEERGLSKETTEDNLEYWIM